MINHHENVIRIYGHGERLVMKLENFNCLRLSTVDKFQQYCLVREQSARFGMIYLQATGKFDKAVTGFKKRQESISKRKCAIEARIEENDKRLEQAEAEMKDVQQNCSIPEVKRN